MIIIRKLADFVRECDKKLLVLILLLTSFGCLEVLSATYKLTGSLKQFIMQVVGMLLGLIGIIICSSFDYRRFARFWYLFAAVAVVPVILTFFIGYAPGSTDDRAWLLLPGGISFQPAELLKIAFVITFGYHVYKLGDRVKKFHNILLLCIHGAIPVMLIHLQGDDGTALVFAIMFIAMLFSAGINIWYFVVTGAAAVLSLPFIYRYVMNEDQQSRIFALLFPTQEDYMGPLWQQWKGRIALANGGLFGQGPFNGQYVQSGSIPEGYNDFIFSSIGEEFGMLGCIAVVIMIIAICYRILRIGHRSGNALGNTICIGVFAMLAGQTIINLGMNLSILPVIGVTLPMLSAGGTSVMCTYLAFALVFNIQRHSNYGMLYLHDEIV